MIVIIKSVNDRGNCTCTCTCIECHAVSCIVIQTLSMNRKECQLKKTNCMFEHAQKSRKVLAVHKLTVFIICTKKSVSLRQKLGGDKHNRRRRRRRTRQKKHSSVWKLQKGLISMQSIDLKLNMPINEGKKKSNVRLCFIR